MFNSKDKPKELESNNKIILSDSSITKKLKIWDIRIQLQLSNQTFKSSGGSHRKIDEGV